MEPGGEPRGGAGGGWLGLTTLDLLGPAKPGPLWLLSVGQLNSAGGGGKLSSEKEGEGGEVESDSGGGG